RRLAWALGGRCGRRLRRWGYSGRHADAELAALSDRALDVDLPAVHDDEPLHETKTDAEAAVRTVELTFRLSEHVEDVRQQIGRNADARVPNPHHCAGLIAQYDDVDSTAIRSVLDGVLKEVLHHLLEPRC